MAQDIYVDASEISSVLLRKAKNDIETAQKKLRSIKTCPMYRSPEGYATLYSSSIISEITSISDQVDTISAKLQKYSAILHSGPENLVEIDSKCKSELTNWWGRTTYSVDEFFTDTVPTAAVTGINTLVNDYQSKGLTYKTVQTVITLGKAVPVVLGCAATWAGTIMSGGAGAPVAVLSTAYCVNTVYSSLSDLKNIWVTEDFDQIGKVNGLKDVLTDGFGYLGEMLGNRDVGELVGEGVYAMGDIIVTIANVKGLAGLVVDTPAATAGKVIQSDVKVSTVANAIKEAPAGIRGLWDIAVNSPIAEVAKDYKLWSYTVPNIIEVMGATKILKEVAKKTTAITEKGIDLIEKVVEYQQTVPMGGGFR